MLQCRTKVSVCQTLMNLKMLVLMISLSTFANALILLKESEDLQKEPLMCRENDVRCTEINRTNQKLSRRLKYILLWTRNDFKPFPQLGNGQNAFIENKCPHVDCYVTNDRNFFKGDLKGFDAIAFNGRNLNHRDLPSKRYNHQQYIYVNMESASNYPVCKSVYDDYFNWTYTYKLNSDILYRYFEIRNEDYKVVGPKLNMKWMETDIDNETLNAVKLRWERRSQAAAWIVSNCRTLNRRDKLAKILLGIFIKNYLRLSTYGTCGELSCPRRKGSYCWNIIEWKYYFYFAFENSNCEDYVTEKLLYPLQHYVIPIVYGGANYSRFLPPGSYLDASKLSPDALVAEMKKAISSLDEYLQYFKWRNMYNYTDPDRHNVCALCTALHQKKKMRKRKSYKEFRKWWFPEYKQC